MNLNLPVVDPRWYQLDAWRAFDAGAQYSVLSWPRRAGKDVTSFSMLVNRAIQKPGNYYYLFPTRAWAQRALWDNILSWHGGARMVDALCPSEIVSRKNNSDFFIDLRNGSRIKIDGTDNLNFVGQGGAGYVLSEFSLHKEEVTGFLAPILTEGDAWVVFNGTLRGKGNHLWKILDSNKDNPAWYSQWLTLEDTQTNYWITPDGELNINPHLVGRISSEDGKPYKNIQDDIDSGLISHTMALQEYLNQATAQVEKSYYGHELEIMHGEKRYGDLDMLNEPVYTFWDLGTSDQTCIVFAHYHKDKFYVIDYHESSGKKIEDYATVLFSRGYNYGGHFAPHDVSKRMLFGDLVTKAHDVGIEFRRVPKTNSVLEDIEICRRRIRDVYMSNRCEDLMVHLENYREGVSGKPVHDEHSHGADAMRTMLMAAHHGLIEHYLRGGKKVHLPSKVADQAEDYCEWETNTESSHPLWG